MTRKRLATGRTARGVRLTGAAQAAGPVQVRLGTVKPAGSQTYR
jgi:hypothetical protein